ncbi:hypothetical protein BSLG_001924 [Batrachochytrium salamandrivorans]|nr:hypothetical protein BSLG_001924 [Batrachochytrium salamandrivorans]
MKRVGRSTPLSDKAAESSPEEQIKAFERKVNHIIEESNFAAAQGNYQQALSKAKEAGKKERQLSKQREEFNLGDQINLDLTYCVLFNLANQYHVNKMYQEALNSYAVIVKNKLFNQSGRLRANMGNIYFEQNKFAQAVKMYRMALDQIPSTNLSFRAQVENHAQYRHDELLGPLSKDEPIEDHEVFNEDALRSIARNRQKTIERYIILAAKLIAPRIDTTFTIGYDWIIESLKSSAINADMASELQIAKSIQYLKTKDFMLAIETLKTFEKKEPKLYDHARDRYHEAVGVDAICTEAMYNLVAPEVIFQIADIYDQQGNTQQAMEWFNILISVVPTDPTVLVKLGSMFERDGDKSQAFQYYSESYRYYPCNMDVIAWLGAYYVDCEVYEQAIQFFERAVLIQSNQVRWHLMIASCYRRSGSYQQAFETYKRIHSTFPENVEYTQKLATSRLGRSAQDQTQNVGQGQETSKRTLTSGDSFLRNSSVTSQDDVSGLLPD